MRQKWPELLMTIKIYGGQFYKEISKFGYFKKMEKVRIKLQGLRKLAAEMI